MVYGIDSAFNHIFYSQILVGWIGEDFEWRTNELPADRDLDHLEHLRRVLAVVD